LFLPSIWLASRGHPGLAVSRRAGAWAAAALLAAGIRASASADPLKYTRCEAAGVLLHVIDVDLNAPRVRVSPAMAAGGVGRCEPFPHFIQRLQPAAAVNGTFFSKRTLLPVGDIVVNGRVAYFGGMGTAIAFGKRGVDVVRLPKSRRVDWSEYRAALAGGPLLVWDGFAKPLPGGEGFGDPHVFARAAPRAAVGVTRGNHLLLVATVRGSSLAALARAMRNLGAAYAINLDGGSSVAMYCRGSMIRSAGRPLTNVLAVYLDPEADSRAPLLPPRGLDWRGGHRAPPVLAFLAEGIRFSLRLPQRWEEHIEVQVSANRPLPEGWALRVRIDQNLVTALGELPGVVPLDLTGLDPKREHELRVNVLNADGKLVGQLARLFRLGEPTQK